MSAARKRNPQNCRPTLQLSVADVGEAKPSFSKHLMGLK
jgi:hypothetical protein